MRILHSTEFNSALVFSKLLQFILDKYKLYCNKLTNTTNLFRTSTHIHTHSFNAAVRPHKAKPVMLGTASWTQHTLYSFSSTKLYPPLAALYHLYTNYHMPRHLPSGQLSAWVAEVDKRQ